MAAWLPVSHGGRQGQQQQAVRHSRSVKVPRGLGGVVWPVNAAYLRPWSTYAATWAQSTPAHTGAAGPVRGTKSKGYLFGATSWSACWSATTECPCQKHTCTHTSSRASVVTSQQGWCWAQVSHITVSTGTTIHVTPPLPVDKAPSHKDCHLGPVHAHEQQGGQNEFGCIGQYNYVGCSQITSHNLAVVRYVAWQGSQIQPIHTNTDRHRGTVTSAPC